MSFINFEEAAIESEKIAKERQKQWDESRSNSSVNHPSHYRVVN